MAGYFRGVLIFVIFVVSLQIIKFCRQSGTQLPWPSACIRVDITCIKGNVATYKECYRTGVVNLEQECNPGGLCETGLRQATPSQCQTSQTRQRCG